MTGLATAMAVVGVGLSAVFFALSVGSLGLSVSKRRADRRSEQAHESVRETLFDRMERDEPAWFAWVESLPVEEREALMDVVRHYLRLVEGSQREELLAVADALDLGRRADETLEREAIVPRLQALTTLTMVPHPVSIDRLLETCSDTQLTREAAARLLAERRDEYDDAAAWGTMLLVWEGHVPISVYGLQTLSELNEGDESPLFEHGSTTASVWNQQVTVQVCSVLEYTHSTDPDASFGWLFELLDHEEPALRAAAVGALKQHGWRADIRTFLDIDALVEDDSREVRQATYEVLTYWGDDEAREHLREAVASETDERCLLVGVRGLATIDAEPIEDGAKAEATWQWLQAELAVSQDQQLPSSSGGVPSS